MDARTRKIIESETDPRILQALLADAVAHIEKQKVFINELQAAKLKKDQATLEQRRNNAQRALSDYVGGLEL